jgi:hypothetical protein
MKQSYTLDGIVRTITRNPATGECVRCEIIEKTGELLAETRWQTAPDDGGDVPAIVAQVHRPKNAQNGPEMPENTRRKAQRPAPVLEGQAALF